MTDVLSTMQVGAATGLAIAMPVGAVGAMLVVHASRGSARASIAAALGVASADGGYALIAAQGGVALKEHVGTLLPALRALSTAILLSVAVVLVWRAFRPIGGQEIKPDLPPAWSSYWTFLGLTAVNPLTLVYFCSVAVGIDDVGRRPDVALAFAVSALATSAAWQLCLVAAAGSLREVVVKPRGRALTHLFAAALVVIMAVRGVAS